MKKYALTALIVFGLSLCLFIYGMVSLGIFRNDEIIVSTLATTGPDYKVSFGEYKLGPLMPDSLKDYDVTGIMVTNSSSQKIGALIETDDDFDDYYLLKFKMVGVKKSDGFLYHPLLEIISCKQINILVFGALVIMEFFLVTLFYFLYVYHKKQFEKIE